MPEPDTKQKPIAVQPKTDEPLDPRCNRLDYGAQLAPPKGYQLEFAVGTTYSLDLNALTTAILALGTGEETDSALAENPISLLEAMLHTADNVLLFCQQGQIHPPENPTPLHALLDKCVIPVNIVKNGRNYSFHPKCWLLHYTPVHGEDGVKKDRYRFIVLSRNLTWDRSWDVAFSIDGDLIDGAPGDLSMDKNEPLKFFLQWLHQKSIDKHGGENQEKLKKLDKLASDLNQVVFRILNESGNDRPYLDFTFIPVGVRTPEDYLKTPLFRDKYKQLVVMSPFLSKQFVEDILARKETCGRTALFTRRTALPDIVGTKRSWGSIYVLKDAALYGENELSEGETASEVYVSQDIHAKIYMHSKGGNATLYIGSLNATNSALHGNVEFMVALQMRQHWMNRGLLVKTLCCGDPEDEKGKSPFMKVALDPRQEKEKQPEEEGSRLIQRILNAQPTATVSEDHGLFEQKVVFADDECWPNMEDWIVTVRPLLAKGIAAIPLEKEMIFSNLSRTGLSEFFVFTIQKKQQSEPQEEQKKEPIISRVAVIPTTGIPEEEREKEVIRGIITNESRFHQYVAYLLGDDKVLDGFESGLFGDRAGSNQRIAMRAIPDLYDKLLKAAATYQGREKIKRIQKLMNSVAEDGVVPEKFKKVFAAFEKAVDHGK